jgi:hypothetical protein
MTPSRELREYAEVPDRFTPVAEGSSVSRFDDGRVCVVEGLTWASVTGVDIAEDEVAALVAEVRARVPAEKNCTWWLGPSTRPSDLSELLPLHGLTEPRDGVSKVLALVLTDEPPKPPAGLDVHLVETFDEYVASRQVQWDAFDVPEERRAIQREHVGAEFEESTRFGVPVTFTAALDGRVGATAMAIPSERGVFLIAGATAPWARGRGLYRALVHARWEYAVARGTPALVTQADPKTSYPILKRLGFEDVCEIRRLDDRRQSTGSTLPSS